jgi:hypothetical protein
MPEKQPNTLTKFRANFKGVRQNRFLVKVKWPVIVTGTGSGASVITGGEENPAKTSLLIKAADIPESSIGVITVPWMGRAIKFSGERTYVDWSIQIYESNEAVADLRRNFEMWMEAMDNRNTHNISYNVTADWEVWYNDVKQNDTVTNPVGFTRGIKLKNCFPINIGTLQMDYDLADSFSVFPVTLGFDYWVPLEDLAGSPTIDGYNSDENGPNPVTKI